MADYYFAYGSNLNLGQFSRRCPGAKAIGRLTLPDFRLVFRHVADIIDAPGECVEGALYRITPRCEKALDRYEGFPRLYDKRSFLIEMGPQHRRRVAEVMFYVMNDDCLAPPPKGYLRTIEDGYDDWDIPRESLTAAVERTSRAKVKCFANPHRDGGKDSELRRRGETLPRVSAHCKILAEA